MYNQQKKYTRFFIHCRPWDKDRYMSPDIKEATDLLKTEKIWNAVKNYMEQYHAKQVSNLKYSKEAQLT